LLTYLLQVSKWRYREASEKPAQITPNNQRTYILSTHGTVTEIDYLVSHKRCPNKFQGIRILHTTFPNHSAIKLEINNRRMRFKKKNYIERYLQKHH
jgi:hypothetical protein